MKVFNPDDDRSILASIAVNVGEAGTWFEIPAGESIDVDDYVVASTLVEHGATAAAADLQAARELWAERNRQQNSRTASAAASEGEILSRQQRTVDVVTGTVSEPLKGSALSAAVAEANASGAGIDTKGSADEKRDALAVWQRARGASSPPAQTRGEEFQTDPDTGELVLDDEGQPIPLAGPLDVDAANIDTVPDAEAEVAGDVEVPPVADGSGSSS